VKYMRNTSWSSTTINMVEIQDFFIYLKQIYFSQYFYLSSRFVKYKIKYNSNRTTCSRDENGDKVCSNLFSCEILAALNQSR
jgi:hypothetical protein